MNLPWQGPFQGQEQVLLPHAPQNIHVLRQEKGLLQGLSDVGRIPSLKLPDEGFPRDGNAIHFQPRRPGALLKSHLGPTRLLPTIHGGGPSVFRVLGHFLLFCPLLRDQLPLLQLLTLSLFLVVRNCEQAEVNCGRRGKIGKSLGLKNLLCCGALVPPSQKVLISVIFT